MEVRAPFPRFETWICTARDRCFRENGDPETRFLLLGFVLVLGLGPMEKPKIGFEFNTGS